MAKKRKAKGRRQQRALARAQQEPDPSKKADPQTMVIQRGNTKIATKYLKLDLRQVMRPLTAMKLKDSKNEHLKDFIDVCGPLGVTHMLVLSATEKSHWLKMARVPQGPTISLRIVSHSLMKDIKSAFGADSVFDVPPLVVLTGFSSEKHHQLMTTMMRKMFPTIDPSQMDIEKSKRVLLLHYDEKKDLIQFRHYGIGLRTAGVSKGLRPITLRKLPTNLDGMKDISEVITQGGGGSESEGEDLDFGQGSASKKRKVKLREIGPRMDLEMVKIEQGVCDGMVLYHKHVKKTLEEVAETERRREKRIMMKALRRKQQEENIKQKKQEREKLEAKSKNPVAQANKGLQYVVDDDEEYYRQEVGEEPDNHFGAKLNKPTNPAAPSRERKMEYPNGDGFVRIKGKQSQKGHFGAGDGNNGGFKNPGHSRKFRGSETSKSGQSFGKKRILKGRYDPALKKRKMGK